MICDCLDSNAVIILMVVLLLIGGVLMALFLR